MSASRAFPWPSWIGARFLLLARGLTEGKARLFLHRAAKHLWVRRLVVNTLLLRGGRVGIEPIHSSCLRTEKALQSGAVCREPGASSCAAVAVPALSLAAGCHSAAPIWHFHPDLAATSCYCCGAGKCI